MKWNIYLNGRKIRASYLRYELQVRCGNQHKGLRDYKDYRSKAEINWISKGQKETSFEDDGDIIKFVLSE